MDPGTNPREAARLDALQQYHIVDTAPEAVFDGIARIAARICDTPMAMVTFIGADHQSIKARIGINLTSTRREDSFCAHILDRTMPMVVEDPIDDPRFAGIPLVADTPKVRFYAGAPIRTESGFGLGAVCVLDVKSRHLEPFQLAALEALADDAMARLEARRATAGLIDVNAKFATAQLLAQVGSWESDVETGELVASDELHRILGVPFGSLRHANQFRHFVHPDDRQRAFAARDAADDPNRPMNIEHRVVRSDGAIRWLHSQGRVERSTVTGRRRFVGTAQDITERHQTESQLREQAALIEGARDAIMVRSLDNVIQSWNSGAERIFGWTAEEAIGRDAMQLLHRDPEASHLANAQLISTGHWAGELRKVTKTGAEVIVDGSWTLLRHSDGTPKSVLVINTDVTDKRKLEAQYLRAQRMESIGTLAGGIAHDLNNMLAPILMSIDLLNLLMPSPEAAGLLDTIQSSARRGADLVKQVLTFGRGVAGQRVQLMVAEIIGEIAKLAHDTFPPGIEIVSRPDPDLWWITGDRTQIHQVLLNLVVNARDAMPGGGRLELSATNMTLDAQYASMTPDARADNYVVIQVSDTGSGIPAEIRERIFEPFFTTKGVGEGTGLGLATVQAIVRSHGGFVTVYSEVDSGTTFKVYVPARDGRHSRASEAVQDALPRGHGETVLVVDDEAAIRDISRQTLEAFGYKVLTAVDGADALAVVVQAGPTIQAIITDIMMPIMDGPALIQAVRRLAPTIPIIAASGLTANRSGSTYGVRHFLSKPYTADAMLRALRDVLQGDGTLPPGHSGGSSTDDGTA